MKKGDNILCIKNFVGTRKFFENGKHYIIDEISDYNKISHEIVSPKIACAILKDGEHGRTAFLFEKYKNCYYFYDYFIILKEERKKKLIEINKL